MSLRAYNDFKYNPLPISHQERVILNLEPPAKSADTQEQHLRKAD